MKDKSLLVLALIWSLLGIFALLMIANFSEPPQLSISELEGAVGKIVSVTGSVKDINYKEDVVFLTLQDSSGSIEAVYFGNPKYEIIKDDVVAVKGKVQIYRGQTELVIQELACLSCQ